MKYINNKFLASIVLIAVIATIVFATATQGEGTPKAKFAIAGSTTEVGLGEDPIELFNVTMKGTNGKAYDAAVSAECLLMTDTRVKSNKGETVTDWDKGSIKVWVNITDIGNKGTGTRTAFPNEVTFAERFQLLEGKLNNIIECDEDGTNCVMTEDSQEIRLLLNTTEANSFHFIITNLDSTVYNIKVWAMADLSNKTATQIGDEHVAAAIGDRTLVIEEIRLAKNNDIVDETG